MIYTYFEHKKYIHTPLMTLHIIAATYPHSPPVDLYLILKNKVGKIKFNELNL